MKGFGGLTSPISAFVTSGLNLWSPFPTCTVCVFAGAEEVVLDFELVVADGFASVEIEESAARLIVVRKRIKKA